MKFKNNKQKFLIVGIVLVLIFAIGGFINFYGLNIFTSMIMEKKSPRFILTIFTWLSIYSIAIEFVLAFMFVVRAVLHPQYFKKMVKTYSVELLILSFIGLVATFISGYVKYGSLVKPYPFPGFHIVMIVFHALIIAFAIFNLTYSLKHISNDVESKCIKVSYVFRTIGLLFIYIILFNRFGALLWAPIYGTYIPYGKLAVFYIYLLLPALILAQGLVYAFGAYKQKPRLCKIITSSLLFITIAMFATILAFELTDPEFVSKISMAMAIERASSKPVDTILMGTVIPCSLIAMIIEQSIKFKNTKINVQIKNKNGN